MVWTEDQKKAIFAEGGRILVSAAAGSGKTAVLVERVIRRLVDKENYIPANKIMVATFSNAAAKEMLERIESKLAEHIMEQPDNLRLQRQRILLNQARISTVHSFCLNLIRENFHKLNISSDFRIGDESELELIKNRTIDEILEEFYIEANKDFLELVELLNDGGDDKKLVQVIFQIHRFISAHPYPKKWLEENLLEYNGELDIQETSWGKILLKEGKEAINHLSEICLEAITVIKRDENIIKAYLDSFETVNDYLVSTKKTIDKGNWDEIFEKVSKFNFPNLGRLVGYNDSFEKKIIQSIQGEIKSVMSKLSKNTFFIKDKEHKQDMKELTPRIKMLFRVVSEYSDRFFINKQRNNLLDFSDLEHLCLSLLLEEDGGDFKKTNLAKDISKKYDMILVDEYQDTNEVQDLIFKTVSKDEKNLFMVGDVKQSIYSFRQAMPDIFIKKRKDSVDYNSDTKDFPASISLGKNFRSREEVCNGINTIFKDIMSQEVGGVDYEKEMLEIGASYPLEVRSGMTILAVNATNQEKTVFEQEAELVAQKIAQLIDTGYMVLDKELGEMRPARYEDFCILLRSRTHIIAYEEALAKIDIPSWSDFSSTFFSTKEIMQMVSLLQAIDNPLLDIELVSSMMSPMFGFTPDEMVMIRTKQEKYIYLALHHDDFKENIKIQNFIEILNALRNYSISVTVDKVIEKIFQLTYYDLYVRSMKNGSQRLLNLQLLIKKAKEYENAGYRGLSGFNRLILNMIAKDLDIKRDMSLPDGDNIVKIMTMHRSKGLEFPICFVVATSQRFNLMDLHKPTLLHARYGFGCKNKDLDSLKRYSTLPYEALKIEMRKDSLSEEMRILYVAMTRAKEKLFILASERNLEKKISNLWILAKENKRPKPFTVQSQNSFSDWILLSALNHEGTNILKKMYGLDAIEGKKTFDLEYYETKSSQVTKLVKEEKAIFKEDPILLKELRKRLDFVYKYESFIKTPSKLGVSEIASREEYDGRVLLKRPQIMYSSGLSPTEKGNAHHTFMQYADYKKGKENPEKEIKNLLLKKYLTVEEAEAIDPKKIKKFFSSNLSERIFSSKNVKRELSFIVAYNNYENTDFRSEEDSTMIQGIVDCVFEESGKLVIVDYKTDRVQNPEELILRYENQLELYAKALEESTDKKIKEKIIYSFYLDKEIAL